MELSEYNRSKKRGPLHAVASAAGSHAVEPVVVLAEDFRVAQARAEAAHQDALQARFRPGEAVVDPQPLFPPDDQPVLAQSGEVPGNGRLGQFERAVEVADADLPRSPLSRFNSRRRTGSASALSRLVDSSRPVGRVRVCFILLSEYTVFPPLDQEGQGKSCAIGGGPNALTIRCILRTVESTPPRSRPT